MADKYVVSDAGGTEKSVTPRNNPLDSIVAAGKAEKSQENPKDALSAGDAAVASSEAVFAGKEEGVVPQPQAKEVFNCRNCRKMYSEEEVRKEPIDYNRNEDGSLSKAASRFSVFCKVCGYFFRVIDHDAQKVLNEMIRKSVKN